MIDKEKRQNIIKAINGIRKDLGIVRQNLNEVQNMLYKCSTAKEFEKWLDKHDPENGTKYIMLFGE